MSVVLPHDPDLSAMIRQSNEAIKRSRELMEKTLKLLAQSRLLQAEQPVAKPSTQYKHERTPLVPSCRTGQ